MSQRDVIPFPGTDRRPPYSPEAEMSVLGGMFIDRDAAERVPAILSEGDFFPERHRILYGAMRDLSAAGDGIDVVTLAERLKNAGKLESVGGVAYLAQLMDAVPTAANIEYHARIVREKAVLRRLIEAASQVIREAYSEPQDADALVADAGQAILSLADSRISSGMVPLKSLLWPTMERLEAPKWGIRSGLSDLDEYTLGFQPDTLYLLAARPSQGKSALLGGIALHAAIGERKRTAFFSTEAGEFAFTERAIASEARVNLKAYKRARMDGREGDDSVYPRVAQASALLNVAPFMLDTTARTVLEMKSRLHRMISDGGVDLVFVDHIHEMHGPGSNDERMFNQIGKDLKKLSKDLHVPVIAAAQLSRKVEDRPDKRPIMSDLRQSGGLEEAADMVGLLYRPEYYFGKTMKLAKSKDAKEENIEGLAELIIGKNRDGETGKVMLYFHKEFTRFESFGPKVGS